MIAAAMAEPNAARNRIDLTPRSTACGSRLATVTNQPVAHTTHGLDAAPAERLIDLAAQCAHVHLDDVDVTVEGHVPHLVDDIGLGDDLAGPACQAHQHGELLGGQLNRYRSALAASL